MSSLSPPSPDTLFAYLDERGIKQTWLSDRLELSPGYLTNIKMGRKPVPDWLPEKAAEVLGVPVEELFPDSERATADVA